MTKWRARRPNREGMRAEAGTARNRPTAGGAQDGGDARVDVVLASSSSPPPPPSSPGGAPPKIFIGNGSFNFAVSSSPNPWFVICIEMSSKANRTRETDERSDGRQESTRRGLRHAMTRLQPFWEERLALSRAVRWFSHTPVTPRLSGRLLDATASKPSTTVHISALTLAALSGWHVFLLVNSLGRKL
ncbi:hypothetical protein OH77DRAFT_957494 [Trametes cingulata]|nr:hypothetical protein OH77DRAFT_957494 [Trametes cingulata]